LRLIVVSNSQYELLGVAWIRDPKPRKNIDLQMSSAKNLNAYANIAMVALSLFEEADNIKSMIHSARWLIVRNILKFAKTKQQRWQSLQNICKPSQEYIDS